MRFQIIGQKATIDQEGIWILDKRIRKLASVFFLRRMLIRSKSKAGQPKEGPRLCERLRVDEVRKALEMTQAVFADSIGMTQSGYATLIKREGPTQRKDKGLKTLALAIEAAHGIRHQWILTGDEPRTVQYQKWLHYVEWKRRGLNDSDL
jgi:DNA-binding transcriptional regulator YiaG